MSKLVKKNKIPSRLGNRANSSNYVPNKEELEDYSLCTEKQKEELEKMKTKTLNKERFQILYDNLPELFVHEEKFVLIDKRLVNIYCVAIKNGRSNVRKTISNFYKGFLNVTPRTNKGFILLKNGTTLEEIDNCKGLKEFKEEIKGILQKPRKRKRTRKTQKKAKSIPLALKLQKPNPKKIFKNLKTSRLVPETDGEFKRRRKKQPNYEIEKQAILVEKIANCFQEETDLEEQNNLFSIPNNYFDFDKEDFNFSQSDSEFSTSDYEETDDSDYQIETNITCPKSPSIFHLDSTDFNLGISEIPGLSPKEFIDFNFLHKDFMTTIGEGTLVNHTYHEDEKLYDRNIIY